MNSLATGQLLLLACTHLCAAVIGAVCTRIRDGAHCTHHHHIEEDWPHDI